MKTVSAFKSIAFILFATGVFSAPQGTDWKASLGLSKEQQQRLQAQDKIKSTTIKPLRENQELLVGQLTQKVKANASESDVGSTFSQIKSGMRSIEVAELSYWDSLGTFLASMQEAKIFLKSHPPKPPTSSVQTSAPAKPAPAAPATKPATAGSNDTTMSPQAWKTFFAVTKDQQQQLDNANKSKSATVKPLRENQDATIEQLRQKVDANASETDIKGIMGTIVSNMKTLQDAEIGYWDTVAGFLSQIQTAKLFLRQKHKL
jgi:hypothetical protein